MIQPRRQGTKNAAPQMRAEYGPHIKVWELYRKRAVKHGLKQSAYFGKASFKQVYDRS